jgi:small basic protein (TIGR04137 family)
VHPSLNIKSQSKKQRSVLKRCERLKILGEKGLWHKGDSVFSLPKVKIFRIKIKKEKAAEKPVEGTALATEATPAAVASPAKTPPAKS